MHAGGYERIPPDSIEDLLQRYIWLNDSMAGSPPEPQDPDPFGDSTRIPTTSVSLTREQHLDFGQPGSNPPKWKWDTHISIDASRVVRQAQRCADKCPPRTREVVVGYEDEVNEQSVEGPPPHEFSSEDQCLSNEDPIRLFTKTVPDTSCETACYVDNATPPLLAAGAALLGEIPLTISAQFPVEKATVDVRFTAEEDFTGFRIGLRF